MKQLIRPPLRTGNDSLDLKNLYDYLAKTLLPAFDEDIGVFIDGLTTDFISAFSQRYNTVTLTSTDFTTTITVTGRYTLQGKQVTLMIPDFSGTSNVTTFSITGLPAALAPPFLFTAMVKVLDDGNILHGVVRIDTAIPALISVSPSPTLAAWTASGTKTLKATTLSWILA